MDEVNLAPQSNEATIQKAFDDLKASDTAEQEIGCLVVGKRLGATLRQR